MIVREESEHTHLAADRKRLLRKRRKITGKSSECLSRCKAEDPEIGDEREC